MTTRPSVLFACIHNSGRSVAAQALTRHYAGEAVEVRSAGSDPGSGVNPVVAQVLAERGLPVTEHVPTKLDHEVVQDRQRGRQMQAITRAIAPAAFFDEGRHAARVQCR